MKISAQSFSRISVITAALGLFAMSESRGALTAYYTLDDLAGGIQNLGTDGATSDLSAPTAAATPTPVLDGIIGGALSFDGNDVIRALAAGNAGDDLLSYPFTLSIWIRNVATDTARDAAFGISDIAAGDRYYVVGSQGVGGRAEVELIRRNTQFTELNAAGTDVSGSTWTNIVGVYGPTDAEIYVGGKLVASAAIGQTFNPTVNTISIGGFLRNGGTHTDPFAGQADDAGIFDTGLGAADVALINGLGLTGGIGLDQVQAAQALNAMVTGSTMQIGSATWQKVTGLAGTAGDFGGTVAGGDAFIVTSLSGDGIQVIPEPSAAGLIVLGVLGLMGRRSRGKEAVR